MQIVNRDNPIDFLPKAECEVIKSHQEARPVILGPLMAALGIGARLAELSDGVSGEAYYSEGESPSGFVVKCSKTHSRERQRFSTAHEIGHCLLHSDEVKRRSASGELFVALNRAPAARHVGFGQFEFDPFEFEVETNERRREREANRFAACLLMPASLLNKLWRAGVRDERAIASKLWVSIEALRRRMKDLRRAS